MIQRNDNHFPPIDNSALVIHKVVTVGKPETGNHPMQSDIRSKPGLCLPRSLFASIAVAALIAGCGSSSNDDDSQDAVVPRSIDFCRLQFPTAIGGDVGSVVTVFGRLFSAGLTDLSGANDTDPAIAASVGVGPDGSDPASDPGWSWTSGTANPGYNAGSPNYEANNDEYQADLTLPGPAGDYDFAFRFSGDAGVTFTYCDSGMGTTDGYDAADAGQLTSTAPPLSGLLLREYIEGSGNNKAVEIYNGTGGSVDLSTCEIRVYANASLTPTSITALSGNLAADAVVGVCNPFADAGIQVGCTIRDAAMNFTGNDAVALVCNAANIDVIGQIGIDPGLEWSNGGVGTRDETLRRNCLVTAGDTNGSDVFDPSVEWFAFALDDFSNFGVDHCP